MTEGIAVMEEKRDRLASRRDRTALNTRRRAKGISFSALARHMNCDEKWLWERLSEKSAVQGVRLSELRTIRKALDEILAQRAGGR